MTVTEYAGFGELETRLVEELAEVIQEVCKAQRFGWSAYHPDDPTKMANEARVLLEMRDVVRTWNELHDAIDGPGPAIPLLRWV